MFTNPAVTARISLLIGALCALALGTADAWYFHDWGVWDGVLIAGGLSALGLNVGTATVSAVRANSLRKP